MRFTLLLLLLSAVVSKAEPIRFQRDVLPILSNHCFKCHGPDLKKAGLDLQSFAGATGKLESGAVPIVPGKAAESELLKRVASRGDDRMPPKGAPLKPAQIATLQAWVEQGAKYEEHWAYVKPVKPAPPAVKNGAWVRNPIDAFALARMEAEGLAPRRKPRRPCFYGVCRST